MRKTSEEIRLRIVLAEPTVGVDFGLQKGRGSAFEIVQKKRSKGADIKFEFSIALRNHEDESPDFGGPFVQGPRGDRFVYVNIGTYAGQENTPWSRRLKVPLSLITRKLISSHQVLVAKIPGTDKGGGPSCAYEWRRRVDPTWQWEPLDS